MLPGVLSCREWGSSVKREAEGELMLMRHASSMPISASANRFSVWYSYTAGWETHDEVRIFWLQEFVCRAQAAQAMGWLRGIVGTALHSRSAANAVQLVTACGRAGCGLSA